MGIEYYLSLIPCLAVPFAFGVWWILMKLGRDKRWFVMPGRYISRNFYFALPTYVLGLVSLLVGLLFLADDPNSNPALFFEYATFFLWGLSFVFAYLEPDWLAPKWYRWLKREHGEILSLLAQEAHQLGRDEWLKRVKTQEDLENWVAEVRRKWKNPN